MHATIAGRLINNAGLALNRAESDHQGLLRSLDAILRLCEGRQSLAPLVGEAPYPRYALLKYPREIQALLDSIVIGIAQNAGREEIVADRVHPGRIHGADGAALAAQVMTIDQCPQRGLDQRRLPPPSQTRRYGAPLWMRGLKRHSS
ncbi:hypothetical protein [Mesorhizobium kowhaii]|uniref:hypothetical protein n=1 Tax=Mesorhizobium kowhaii TaxID=1300272 RepID=UPI00142D5067|nr:hypothetical protein [Mesorhizobium kowhaii]